MQSFPKHYFEFGPFRVEVEERRLTRNGEPLVLTAKAFDILLTLIERSGQTIGKDDLLRSVWSDTFVEEGNLNHHISTLRKVLGDSPREQRFIKTIPKHGYRFTAKVREIEEVDETLSLDTVTRGQLLIREETLIGFWTPIRVAAASCLFVTLVAMGIWALSRSDRTVNDAARSEAVEAYKRGRALWQTRDAGDLHEATLLLEQAIQKDPEFALAHAALADAHAFDYANWRKAEPAARRAIALDPVLGEPHASIGFVRMFWEWDLPGAQEEFKRAVALNPYYATARQWFALGLAANRHGDASLVEIGKALELEPHSVPINTDHCQLLYYANRYQEAAAQCREVLKISPDSTAAREWLYQIEMSDGDLDRAVEQFVQNLKRSEQDSTRKQADRLAAEYAAGGIDRFRPAQIAHYIETEKSWYRAARTLAESSQTTAAIDALKRAAHFREFEYIFRQADPAFAELRRDPRWAELTFTSP